MLNKPNHSLSELEQSLLLRQAPDKPHAGQLMGVPNAFLGSSFSQLFEKHPAFFVEMWLKIFSFLPFVHRKKRKPKSDRSAIVTINSNSVESFQNTVRSVLNLLHTNRYFFYFSKVIRGLATNELCRVVLLEVDPILRLVLSLPTYTLILPMKNFEGKFGLFHLQERRLYRFHLSQKILENPQSDALVFEYEKKSLQRYYFEFAYQTMRLTFENTGKMIGRHPFISGLFFLSVFWIASVSVIMHVMHKQYDYSVGAHCISTNDIGELFCLPPIVDCNNLKSHSLFNAAAQLLNATVFQLMAACHGVSNSHCNNDVYYSLAGSSLGVSCKIPALEKNIETLGFILAIFTIGATFGFCFMLRYKDGVVDFASQISPCRSFPSFARFIGKEQPVHKTLSEDQMVELQTLKPPMIDVPKPTF